MKTAILPLIGAASAWRDAARRFLAAGIPPEEAAFALEGSAGSLFEEPAPAEPSGSAPRLSVPRAFVEIADQVCWHRDPERFAILYRLLWRISRNRDILNDPGDADVARVDALRKAVRRDAHKMKAFVRFRELPGEGERRRFAAWFEPDHFVLEPTAPFFARRFGDMDWVIVTPAVTARFANGSLGLEPTAARPVIGPDETEALWLTYFASIFNPARLKVKAMKAEMPVKYWKNLPEARLLPQMIAEAGHRADGMRAAAPTLPHPRAAKLSPPDRPSSARAGKRGLGALGAEARECTRCPLHRFATQTVFGEGPGDAKLVLVGEQPGDREDLAGRPFVGPAGQLLDRALVEAEIDRSICYVTNAVKHFKFEPRGKRRIHKRPDTGEVVACKWWLDRELGAIRPSLVVAMGATAAQALTGNGSGILKRRGTVEYTPDGMPVFLTVHPSMILRIPDPGAAEEARLLFVSDLRRAGQMISEKG